MSKTSSAVFPWLARVSQRSVPWLIASLDQVAKRTFDLFAAAIGLVMLAPVFLVVGILIKRDTPGPIFYRGPRSGQNGKIFRILKFRTMAETQASYEGAQVTAQDDPRVTRLGRWLRRTKFNELPQLWNVLRGEMSLVGPRPEDPAIVKTWDEGVRRELLSIRPGITSAASVLYRDEESLLNSGNVMDAYMNLVLPSKLRLDQLYVRHRSLLLDLDILFWTFLVLFPLVRSHGPSEDLLFLGPISRLVRRYVSWFVIDILITLMSITAAGVIWRFFRPLNVGLIPSVLLALGFAWLYSMTGLILGMDRIAWSQAWASEAVGLVVSAVLATVFALILNQSWSVIPLLPPTLVVVAATLSLVGFVATRYRVRLLTGFASRWLELTGAAGAARERVLIIGGGSTGQFVAWLLSNGPSIDLFKVVGYVDDDLYKQGRRYHGINMLGRRADIPRLVKQNDIGIILFAIHNIDSVERRALIEVCQRTLARVIEIPDIAASLLTAIGDKPVQGRGPVEPGRKSDGENPLFTSRGIPAVQVQQWLTDFERLAKAGNLDALNSRINSIRKEIQKPGMFPF